MKTFITTMLAAGILSHAFAQNLPGTKPWALEKHSRYQFEFEKGNKLVVYAPNVRSLQQFQNIDSTLALFVRDFKKIKTGLEETTNARTVIYKPLSNGQYQLDLKEHISAQQRFQLRPQNAEPLLLKTSQDTLLIVQNATAPVQIKVGNAKDKSLVVNELVYFCFVLNNLEDAEVLAETSTANAHIRKALEDVKKYTGHDLTDERFSFEYTDTSLSGRKFRKVQNKKEDFIAVHPSFGIGLFRNQWVPNSQVDFTFVPNRYKTIGYTVGWRSMFFTERDDQTQRFTTHSNGFVQVGVTFYDFRRPSSKQINTQKVLFGAYLGHSVTRNGPIFDKNTWNFSMTVTTYGMFKIQPEIYFNGFFKSVQPGLRLQIGI